MLSRDIGTKDFNLQRITSLSQMTFNEGGRGDLNFHEPVNFDETLNDYRDWNITWQEYVRDAAKIGGAGKYMEDYFRGMKAMDRAMQQVGYKIYDELATNTNVDTFDSTAIAFDLADTEVQRDADVEKLLIDGPNRLRGLAAGGMQSTTINILAPTRVAGFLTRYLAKRETILGDKTVKGALWSSLYNVRIGIPASAPVEFNIGFSSNPTAGETLGLVRGSNYAFVKFVASSATPGVNEVKLGASAGATAINLKKFLVDMANPKGTADYGSRAPYDVSGDDVKTENGVCSSVKCSSPQDQSHLAASRQTRI